jgi:hypothetical protein
MGPMKQAYTFKVHSGTAFWVNGWLVDLIRIEHWGRDQGAGKLHGIRTALSVLKHFIQKLQRAEDHPLEPHHIERAILTLQRLADYGYYVPPEIFETSAG